MIFFNLLEVLSLLLGGLTVRQTYNRVSVQRRFNERLTNDVYEKEFISLSIEMTFRSPCLLSWTRSVLQSGQSGKYIEITSRPRLPFFTVVVVESCLFCFPYSQLRCYDKILNLLCLGFTKCVQTTTELRDFLHSLWDR